MNIAISKTQNLWRTALIDAVLVAVACFIPTISHIVALPLYQLNPMLLVLLAGMLLVSDRRNAFLLAVLLPAISMLAVGMPTPVKALCMVPEFLTVVAISTMLQGKAGNFVGRFGCMVAAILSGKVVYYGLKAMLIGGALISTPVLTQLLVVVAASLAFAAICKK